MAGKLGELLILLKAKNEVTAELTKTNTQLEINKTRWNETTQGTEKIQSKLAVSSRRSTASLRELRTGLMSVGTAMTATGSLLNRIDNDFAKSAGNVMVFAGSAITAVSGIMQMLIYLPKLTTQLRNLAIMQGVVSALSGPGGWAKLAIGGAVAGGAIYGISQMASSSNSSVASSSKANTPVQIVISGDAKKMGITARQETYKYQDRNSSSGMK